MKTRDKQLSNLIALLLLFVYLSPYILFPHSAHFLIHDNLNSGISWFKMIAESGLTFSSSTANFPNVFNGIPRGCMPSPFDIYTILNLLCSPLAAYCILVVLQHTVAYFGMRRLLTDYVFKNEKPYHVALLSLAFALLPYWPLGEFCVAGQPFVIWALLNLHYGRKTLYNWLIIILFPFCSSNFVFSNLFFLSVTLVAILILFYRSKKWNMQVILGWGLLFILSTISIYHLFHLQFIEKIQSARGSGDPDVYLNWKGYLRADLYMFFKGQYHFYACQFPVITATLLFSLFIVRSVKYYLLIAAGLLLMFLLCSIDTFHLWNISEPLFKILGSLRSVQMRFETLLPLLWFLLFAVSTYYLLQKGLIQNFISLALISVQIIFLFFDSNSVDYAGNSFPENAFYYTYIRPKSNEHGSFDDYFAPDKFEQAKKDIDYKKEVVLCVGFPSEVAQFNNFYTAAAYLSYYPIERKQEIYNIFAPGVKNLPPEEVNYIASRSSEYYSTPGTNRSDIELNIDTLAMKKMDIKYVLSNKVIENSAFIHLQNIDSLSIKNSIALKHLYIYKVL